jgi:four helix bundle protein
MMMDNVKRFPTPESRDATPDTSSSDPREPRYEIEIEARDTKQYAFLHQRLDVYRVALKMASRSRELSDRVPRGYKPFADQLLRAAGHAVLLIAEGANRYTAGQKRQRYTEARGECGEVAAAVELLATMRLAPRHDAEEIENLAGRVAAMLTRLIQRNS